MKYGQPRLEFVSRGIIKTMEDSLKKIIDANEKTNQKINFRAVVSHHQNEIS